MPTICQPSNFHHCPRKQRGAALMVMLVIMIMGSAAFLVSSLSKATLNIERNKVTATALAQAKDALIGYATSVNLFSGSARLGDLPCPDNHIPGTALEGTSSTPCNGSALGRLPWKSLGLPDLHDSSGERLWYAVSSNFKNFPRTSCAAPGQPGCLNSDTKGTISVFASDGALLNDGGGSTGVVAVVIAPGDVLTRQGGAQQDRSSAGVSTASNYLDIATVGGNTEDNANFSDSSSTNGFIQGRVKDSNGNLIVNDQLLVITQDNIMQAIQKRVAAEVMLCLEDYASNNIGRYPWAAPITDLGSTYNDNSDEYFGRIPDNLDNTQSDGWPSMDNKWGTCNTHTSNTPRPWWLNWKEMVFYGVARSFRPRSSSIPSFPSTCATPGRCLNINAPTTPARFVVIVAGKILSNPNQTQRNSNKTNAFYYLEGGNQNADQSGGYTFIQAPISATFNDLVVFQ